MLVNNSYSIMRRKRIYIETPIIVDYIEMKIERTKDLVQYFGQELKRLRNLEPKYDFIILESSIGEAIGQCLCKGWKIQEVFDNLYDFLLNSRSKIMRSDVFDETNRSDLRGIFDRGSKIVENEWDFENPWGMDIYDIWFLSQVSIDPKAKYIWSSDRRMLDYGRAYLETLCGREINVVDSLRGIK